MVSGVEFGKVAENGACDAIFWEHGDVCAFFLGASNCGFDSLEVFFDLKMKNAVLNDGDSGVHSNYFFQV